MKRLKNQKKKTSEGLLLNIQLKYSFKNIY